MLIYIKGNYFFDFPATPDNDPVSFESVELKTYIQKILFISADSLKSI